MTDGALAVAILGSVLGSVGHILKKAVEDGEQEQGIVCRWIIGKPITTAASVFAGISVALGIVSQLNDASLFMAFLISANAGFSADSMINRPKEVPKEGV